MDARSAVPDLRLNKHPSPMRGTFLILLVALLNHAAVMALPPAVVPATSTVQVVLHIDGFNDALYGRLSTEVGKDHSIGIEYSCTWSGVVVLQFNEAPVSERGDAVTMTQNLLARVGIEKGVEFLRITVEERSGSGKC